MAIKTDAVDKDFSKFIRLRADGVCEYCGKYVGFAKLQCAHFHGRRKWITRCDPDNASALCYSCHNYLDEHPPKHDAFYRKRLGTERYDELNIRSEIVKRRTAEDVVVITKDLKEKIKLLEEG